MRETQSLIIWVVFVYFLMFTILAVRFLGVDAYQAVGLGTVLGVLLKMLSDMWQFYFRKFREEPKKPPEGKE